MQKKVIIPLLMTVPAAMPAFADISMGFPNVDGWEKTGVTEENWIIDPAENSISCVVGTGSVSTRFPNLPTGKYQFRFVNARNIKVTVKVGANEPRLIFGAQNTDGTTDAFEVSEGEAVVMTVEALDKTMGFGFTARVLTLEVTADQYNDIKKAFDAADAVVLKDVTGEDDFEEAVALRTRKTELEKNLAEYNGTAFATVLSNIEQMANGETDPANEKELIALYTAYGLDKTPATVLTYLQNLKTDIETYNADVDAEDAVWARYLANVATRTSLISNVTDKLLPKATALVEAIKVYQVVDPNLPEYVALLKEANDLVADLGSYLKDIETAYPDPAGPDRRALREVITFQNREPEFSKTYGGIEGDFTKFKQDYEAYYSVNFLALTKLKEAYDAYVDALVAAMGVIGYETVYDNIVSGNSDNEKPEEGSLLYMAAELYNATKDNNQLEEVKDAAGLAPEKIAAIEDAIQSFRNDTEAFNNLVDNQNGNMTTAMTFIAESQSQLSGYKKLAIPTTFADEFNDRVKAVQDAIDAFRNYVDEKYGNHELNELDPEYQVLMNNVNTRLDELKTFLEPVAIVQSLLDKLEAAKAEIEGLGNIDIEGEGETTKAVNVADRFNSTYEGLKNAILALTIENASDSSITGPIEDQIGKYLRNAKEYAENFTYAKTTIEGFTTAIDNFRTAIAEKKFDTYREVENAGLKAVKAQYLQQIETNFAAEVARYKADLYNAAILPNDQDSFDKVKELVGTLDRTMLSEDIKLAQDDFAQAGTKADKTFADNRLADFKADLAKAVEAGVTKAGTISTEEVELELDGISKQIDLAASAKEKPAEYAVCDDNIIAALDKLQLLVDQLATYRKNQNNYDSLTTGDAPSTAALSLSLDALRAYNEQTSMTPGKEYYVENVFPGLQEKIDNLNSELASARDEIKIATDEEKAAFEEKINTLAKEISDTRDAITANNKYHNSQLDKEREEREHALSVLEAIQAAIESDGSGDLNLVKGWQNTLNDIINNDIVNENIVVTQAYGKGESAARDAAIMAVYNDIHERIQAIEDGLTGDAYSNAIVEANSQTTAGWSAIASGLWNTWKNAIKQYNYFYYDLKNEGWKNFIHDAIERHWPEFDYYEVIAAIEREETAFVNQANADKHVITAGEWQEWLDRAVKCTTDINGHVEKLLVDADGLAQTYYTQQSGAAQTAIDDAEAALTAAGIDPAGYLAAARGYLESAVTMYNSVEAPKHVSLSMDNIANELDKVIPAINVQAFCEDAWNKEYASAEAQIAEMREQIKAAEFADAELLAAEMTGFEAYVADAAGLNSEVQGIRSGLVDVYGEYSDSLDALLENMRGVVGRIEKSSELNKANQDIFNDYTDIWAPAMEDQYKALKDYCDALGGSGDMQPTLAGIRNAIDALDELVNTHKSTLIALDIEGRYNNVINAIENAYKTASETEISYLRRLRLTAQVAFNDAITKCEGKLTDRLKELGSDYTEWTIEQAISRISDNIEMLRYDAADKEGFKTEALGYENELCNIYNLLQSTWNETGPAVAVKAELDGIYNRIDAAITAGQEYLDGCLDAVKEAYPEGYDTLKSQLDAEQAAWNANGPEIIAHADAYRRHLAAIENAVADLAAQIEAAQEVAFEKAEKECINNERYAALKGEWDTLRAEFDAARELVAGYGNGIAESLSGMANYIDNQLATSLENLETANSNIELTEESTLPDAAVIAANINDYKMYGTLDYARVQFGDIDSRDAELRGKLATLHIVPDVFSEITARQATLVENTESLRDEYTKADFGRLSEIIEEAKGIVESYDSLLDMARENSYVPGDVNLDGEVNVLDVQSLINLIGEGVTYDELYAENPREACAADVTNDNSINIADVTTVIDMILGEPYQAMRVRAFMPAEATMGDARMGVTLVGQEGNVRRYALTLANPVAFRGAQFDISVGSDSRVTGVMNSDRTADHDAAVFEIADGGARVILSNMENRTFGGNDGVILYIEVEGAGNVTVSESLFVDENNRIHTVGAAHSSAVDAILDGVRDFGEKIWDAAGRSFKSLQRGINIIRHKDGSVTKEIRK